MWCLLERRCLKGWNRDSKERVEDEDKGLGRACMRGDSITLVAGKSQR